MFVYVYGSLYRQQISNTNLPQTKFFTNMSLTSCYCGELDVGCHRK